MIASVLFSSPAFNLSMLLLIFSELAFQSHVVITHTNYINASSGAARLAHHRPLRHPRRQRQQSAPPSAVSPSRLPSASLLFAQNFCCEAISTFRIWDRSRSFGIAHESGFVMSGGVTATGCFGVALCDPKTASGHVAIFFGDTGLRPTI